MAGIFVPIRIIQKRMPIQYADPCQVCGNLYLHGSPTSCRRCLRLEKGAIDISRKPPRLLCDCGAGAIVVIRIRVGVTEDGITEERMPLCAHCLEIEKKTQATLDRLGYAWKR